MRFDASAFVSVSSNALPDSEQWLYELKLDGTGR
jgi:hypothetical protein